jgi:putative transposase
MAVVIADGVRDDGVREVLGLDLGPSADGALGRAFLQRLGARGLRGVRLVISDAHRGLKQAIRDVFGGAGWQRCRVPVMRNVIAQVPTSAQAMVAATVRTIFEPPDRHAARAQLRQVCATLQERFPTVVALLEEAEGEILTFYDYPKAHWRQLYSTNPLERLTKAVKRRSAVVGIFPNRAAVLRRFGARLAEQMDEWLVGHRYFSFGSMAKLLAPAEEPVRAVAAATVAVA